MTRWLLKCNECGGEWVLPVSFRLDAMGRIYHYCRYCKRNTFHTVLGELPDEAGDAIGGEEAPNLGDDLAQR